MDTPTAAFPFSHGPTPRVVHGPGAAAMVSHELDHMDIETVLVVSDHAVAEAGWVAQLEGHLGDRCGGVFLDVTPDGSPSAVEAGVAVGEACGADAVVSLGGGSVIGTAKAVAAVLGSDLPLSDHTTGVKETPLPHLCLPTTPGGACATRLALIKDSQMGRWVRLSDAHLLPRTILLDGTFLTTLDPAPLAMAAMDSFAHTLEALISRRATAWSDAFALHGARLILDHLPGALEGKESDFAPLLMAGFLAGTAAGRAGLGMAHALAHTIATRTPLPHGQLTAALLVPVLRFNETAARPAMALAAKRLNLTAHAKSEEEMAARLLNKVSDVTGALPFPTALNAQGIDPKALGNIAREVLENDALADNPVALQDGAAVAALLAPLL